MKYYTWVGRNDKQDYVTGISVGQDQPSVQNELAQYGLQHTQITPYPRWKLWLHQQQINTRSIDDFTYQMHLMLQAGLPITTAITHLCKKKQHLQHVLIHLLYMLQNGASLKDAFDLYPRYFHHHYRKMIDIGQQTGALKEVFYELHKMRHHQSQLRKRLQQALIYPLCIMTISVLMMTMMILFIFPKIEHMYHQFDAKLPYITQCVQSASYLLKAHGLWIIGAFLFIALLARYCLDVSPALKNLLDTSLLKLPLLGESHQTSLYHQMF